MRRFLGFLIVLELLGAGVYFAAPPVDEWLQEPRNPTLEGTGRRRHAGRPASSRCCAPTRAGSRAPSPGSSPRTAATPSRRPSPSSRARVGVTRAVIDNVTVDGAPSTIVWDGGRPLPHHRQTAHSSSGRPRSTADAAGLAWALDGVAAWVHARRLPRQLHRRRGLGGRRQRPGQRGLHRRPPTPPSRSPRAPPFVRLAGPARPPAGDPADQGRPRGRPDGRDGRGQPRPVGTSPSGPASTRSPSPRSGGATVEAILQGPVEV